MTTDELIARCIELKRAEGLATREAVGKVLAEHEPDDDARSQLIFEGLRSYVNDRESHNRGRPPLPVIHREDGQRAGQGQDDHDVEVVALHRTRKSLSQDAGGADHEHEGELLAGAARSGRFQNRPDRTRAHRWHWLSQPYETVDGRSLPLLKHTEDDLARLIGIEEPQVRAGERRLKLFEESQKALAKHPRAKRLESLPIKTLTKLEALAADALRERAMRGTA